MDILYFLNDISVIFTYIFINFSFSSVDLEFPLFDLRQKTWKDIFFACAFTLVTFLVTFFVTLQEFKSCLRLVKVLTGEFPVNPCLKSYATFSSFFRFFNAPTTWNTAAIKILSLFKVGLMVYLFISGWGKRRINERIPGSVPDDNEVFGPGNKVLGVKSIGREQNCSSFLFAFKIKVLAILKMIQWHYQIKKQNWPVYELIKTFASNPKSYRAFRETGPWSADPVTVHTGT